MMVIEKENKNRGRFWDPKDQRNKQTKELKLKNRRREVENLKGHRAKEKKPETWETKTKKQRRCEEIERLTN